MDNKNIKAAEGGARERISEHQAELDQALEEFMSDSKKFRPKKACSQKRRPPEAAAAPSGEDSGRPVPRPRPEGQSSGKKEKKKKKKKKHLFNFSIVAGITIAIAVISISIVLSTGAITLGMEYLGINKSEKEITINIPKGSNNDEIADVFIQNNIINKTYGKQLFKFALRMNDQPTLYPGDIKLSPNTSYADIIEKLSVMRESYKTVTLTFKEGTNIRSAANKLEKNGVCSAEDFLFQFNSKQDGFEIDSKITHNQDAYYAMEGYFFPDTYEFYVNDSAYNVVKMLREHFDDVITDEMYAKMDEMGLDIEETITLASIVQAEAGTVEDMPKVASVFFNRMNNTDEFPSLQSDATKNYVKKVISKAETSTAMLEHYTNLYDTYVCFGLPAGPIGNPGLDAINAVLNPEETDYYYFCNDLETGEAFYAETYKEHKKNLKKAGLTE